MLRALLPAAAFLAVLPAAQLQAQRMNFAGLRWGLPADSVGPRLEALGWRQTGTSRHGDPIFRRDSAVALAGLGGGKLLWVNVVYPTAVADRDARLRLLVDSLASVYGPPTRTSENGSAWEGTLSSMAATSTALEGQSAAVTVIYLGPGAQQEDHRRAGTPDPFPALPEGWIEVARSGGRRMSVDTASITALQEGVYRAGIRFDLLEPQTEEGQRFDAITYTRDHDCTRRRMLARSVVLHFQGQPVREVGDGSWTAARANTGQGTELDEVCALAAEYFRR